MFAATARQRRGSTTIGRHRAIESQLGLIVAHDAGARRGDDLADLHQVRVACRRVRALLREVRPMLEPERVESIRAEPEWLGDELGAARDLDVLRQHVSDEIATLDPADVRGGARLLRVLERQAARRARILAQFPKRWGKLRKRGIKAWH